MDLAFLFLWPFFSILVGVFASRRGRSGIGWFLCALLLSPLLAWIALLAIGPSAPPAAYGVANAEVPSPETHVRCPDCRELVRRDARKCKHCGTALVPQ